MDKNNNLDKINNLSIGGDYIIQPNTVTNSINNFGLYEERVFNAIIYQLQEAINLDKNGKNYKQLNLFQHDVISIQLPLKDISEPRNYSRVKQVIKRMSLSPVSFTYFNHLGQSTDFSSGLFSAHVPTEGSSGGKILINIEAVVADLLIKIQKDSKGNPIQYTRYIYQIAQQVKSPYSSKIYKLISSWKKKGGFYISRKDLYKRLGINEDAYRDHYDFMRRVIKPVHKELFEKADCWFNYKARDFIVKEGDSSRGKVLGYNFKVITREYEEIVKKKIESITDLLRFHFKFTAEELQEVSVIFSDESKLQKISGKIIELSDEINTNPDIIHKSKYTLKALINDFG